jgi:hypothetical protein
MNSGDGSSVGRIHRQLGSIRESLFLFWLWIISLNFISLDFLYVMMAHGRETLAIVVVSTASNNNEVLVHNRVRASGTQSVQVLYVPRHITAFPNNRSGGISLPRHTPIPGFEIPCSTSIKHLLKGGRIPARCQHVRDILPSMWDSPMHLLVLLVLLFAIFVVPTWLAYRHGKKVGDQQGYIRGYKEGQGSK